jgi:Spy/CpxP family protein refolding chaperone
MHRIQMWTASALVGVLGLTVGTAPAAAFHGKDHAEKRVERLTEELGLSEPQAAQVRTILDAQRAEMEQAWTAAREKTRQKLSTVLTPDQQAKHAELMKQRQEHRSDRKGKGHCHGESDVAAPTTPATAEDAPAAPAQPGN